MTVLSNKWGSIYLEKHKVLIFQIFNISNFAKTIIKCTIIEMKYLAYSN